MKNHTRLSPNINASRKLFLVPLLLLLLVGMGITVVQTQNNQQSTSLAGVPKDCTVEPAKLDFTPSEQKLFDKINTFRQANNVPPLVSNISLKQAAAWMGKDLQTRHILVHVDSLGRETATRFSDCGLPFPSIVGEIIDGGNTDVDSLVSAWTHSPSQINRLLNKNFTDVGISLVTGVNENDSYWTVAFSGPNIQPTAAYTYPPYPSNFASPTPTPKPGSVTGSQPTRTPTPTKKITPTPTVNVNSKPTATPTIPPTPTPKKTSGTFGTPTPTTNPIPGKVTPDPKKDCNNPPVRKIDPKFVKNAADTQVFLSVKFPGIGCDGNKTPKHQTRRIQASLIDTENNEIKVGTADLVFDGNYFRGTMHLGNIPNGIYSLKLAGVRTLQKVIEPQFQELNNQKLNIMPELIIRTGDVSEDNALSLEDYNLSLTCFQDKKCKADAIDFIDFNDSGTADVIDYNLLLQAFYQLSGD